MRRRSFKQRTQTAFGVIGFVVLIAAIIGGGFIYRTSTMSTATITPTMYSMSKSCDSDGMCTTTREVFAVEGEYRMKDTFIPWNMETGALANRINEAVIQNKAGLMRTGEYTTTCQVSTHGMRIPLLSLYPVIYEVSCTSGE